MARRRKAQFITPSKCWKPDVQEKRESLARWMLRIGDADSDKFSLSVIVVAYPTPKSVLPTGIFS